MGGGSASSGPPRSPPRSHGFGNKIGLGKSQSPSPLQDQREGQEKKLLLVPRSTIISTRAITAMPRGIFDLNAQNL